MPKKLPLKSPRRVARFSPVLSKPVFFLPKRVDPPAAVANKPGFHTYYLSCDVRGFAIYLPHAVKQTVHGYRAALLAKAGLVFDPPSVVLLGLQDGDTFDHAARWASSNPIDELHLASATSAPITPKVHLQAQKRFWEAECTLEGVEQARLDAEAELEAATAELISAQGVESVCIEGVYYDPTYTRERVYLKRRDPRFTQTVEREPKKRNAKKAPKRRRAA